MAKSDKDVDNTINAIDSISQLLSITIYTAGIDQSIWDTEELQEIKEHSLILVRKLTENERGIITKDNSTPKGDRS